jgi:signal transduction histidine kinase
MLHPPLLDELGLESALRTFITLYERRTAVTVDLVIGALLGRLATEVELGVFRVAQESLFNVHRHSGSPRAEVRLERRAGTFEVFVRDWGNGITPEAARGDTLGIAGMRERVRLLGGQLEIGPAGPGTIVHAVFRLEQ